MATTTTTTSVTSQRNRITLTASPLDITQPVVTDAGAGPSRTSTTTACGRSAMRASSGDPSQGSATVASSRPAAEVADIQLLAGSVSRLTLRSGDDPWTYFSDAELNTRSGRLHGQWSFNDRLSGERPNGRWSNWYNGTGVSGWQNDCGEIHSWSLG